MNKQALRQKYREKRLGIDKKDVVSMQNRIAQHLRRWPLPLNAIYLSFKSIQALNEIDISEIEKVITTAFGSKLFAYPKADFTDSSMTAYIDNELINWEVVKGIMQPVSGTVLNPEEIDVVLVPLLIFDEKGYRVGYGKGFYDRFLKHCRPDTLKIGFCLFEPEKKIDDVNGYDIPLDICVTPNRIYEFK
ncbi:5-formyltetrahydrofolate cyclo-ligase [Polluticaenibacter yanchengensis]|uniref:5-formyltetrahydrofolate cyclo-ligase n=1 Tax=Polluticaenibacter yanchengensis TaxID=3014562 RepID=A0ABT4UMW4_9BACT|nr:5-formyltetrahydrofolate cyclo-ligase [Chitinophagaceae bacterium LY-5]